MEDQGLLAGIAVVIIIGLSLIYVRIQTDSFISGAFILAGLAVLVGGGMVVIKKMS